ncbi:serine/threonine-protein kinase [Nannocystis radixulma]|uniref:Protein kinase n=1 Tax=Nannocystis radixulma TaxID=2995305 RepID=A0ABT5BIU7_9BACT|nr:serine/threonine-protein kinase [Nannocystis radixulma]MDC0673439.1 protein kinase [Nannocystis radixulma]
MAEDINLTGSALDGRYRVVERLGAGGMGTVYRGEHVMLGTELAIKVLSPKFAHDPEWIQRFLLEARAASRIRHPNIVQMHDFAAPRPGLVYMAMELLEGESLADLVRREKMLPWPRVALIAEQIASALAAAHARGIIHRDIKPANVFRVGRPDEPDVIKVLDFGIAKFLSGADEDVESPSTATGALMGTAEYIAPELFMGRRPDARADVYALGVLMYKLLTGRVPFPGNHIVVAQQIATLRPMPPSQLLPPDVSVPPAVDALLLRALRREPEERTASMRELIEELRATAPTPAAQLSASRPLDLSPAASANRGTATETKPEPPRSPPPIDEYGEESTLRRDVRAPPEPITDAKQFVEAPAVEPPTNRSQLPSPALPKAARRPSRLMLTTTALLGLLVTTIWIARESRPGSAPPAATDSSPLAAAAADIAEQAPPTPPHDQAPPEPVLDPPSPATPPPEPVLDPPAPDPKVAEPPVTSPGESQAPTAQASKATTARPTAARKKPAEATTKSSSPPPSEVKSLPQQLSAETILRRLAGMEEAIQQDCFRAHEIYAGTSVDVEVTVDAEGRATVRTSKSRVSPHVKCIATRIEKHQFPQSQSGGAAKYSFVARP